MLKRYFLIFFVLLGLSACKENNPIANLEPFSITILTQDGNPVEGVTISGGIDWDAFNVETNATGKAVLPGSAYNKRVTIYKTNYIPQIINNILPISYNFEKAAKRLDLIGTVLGKSIRFNSNEIITLDYSGIYRVYKYDIESVTEIFSQKLDEKAIAIRDIKLKGDTLWFSTHESGIFVFLIGSSTSPKLLFHLAIQGYLGPFAVKDSILVIGDKWQPNPLQLLKYNDDGNYKEISKVENYFVSKMEIIKDYVILLGNNDCLPTVFDISNPNSPRLVYNGLEYEFQNGFFYKNFVLLTPQNGYGGNNIILDYKVIDISNPGNPTNTNMFSSDSWLSKIITENIASGRYYYHNSTISLLSGNITSNFHTIATVSSQFYIDNEVDAYPPYYLINNTLWELNSW